jgi:hypothetical protein
VCVVSRAPLSHPRPTAARPLQIIPEAVEYRKAVEKFTSYRLNVVKTTLEVRRDTGLLSCEGRCLSSRALSHPSSRSLRPPPAPSQVDDIETKIACGQVEELIEQAKVELRLIPKYASWKVRRRRGSGVAVGESRVFLSSPTQAIRHPSGLFCASLRPCVVGASSSQSQQAPLTLPPLPSPPSPPLPPSQVWESKPPTPRDDHFEDLYDELEYVDPESVANLGLRELAQQKREEAAKRRSQAAAAAAAAAAAPAPAAAGAEKK